MIYTIYHAPEDAHLVRPLARFIELTEVDLVCADSEPAKYAPAGLVMCGRGYENQPWLKKALRSSNTVIAVLLADVDPGVKNVKRVDLRAWPARSADRTLLALADWLKSDGKSAFPGMSASAARSASSAQRSQNIAALVVMSVIVGLFFLVAQSTDQKSDALTPLVPPPPKVSVSSTTATDSLTTTPMSSSTNSGSSTTAPVQSPDPSLISSPSESPAPTVAGAQPGVSDLSKTQTIADVGNHTRIKDSEVPETTRAELDRCYLQRRADGDVPPKVCLISNTIRRTDSQQTEDLL